MSRSVELDQKTIDGCREVHAEWNEMTKVWTLPVIHALGLREPARFNELKRRTDGISATSLAERLTELEREGVVQRKVFPETPVRIEYSLTDKGKDLHDILEEFANWVRKWK